MQTYADLHFIKVHATLSDIMQMTDEDIKIIHERIALRNEQQAAYYKSLRNKKS